MRLHRYSRKIHRLIVPVALMPLLAVSFSGALYGTLIAMDIEWSWLLRIHTGNFGVINLQPFYSPVLGILILIVAISGASLLISPRRVTPGKQS